MAATTGGLAGRVYLDHGERVTVVGQPGSGLVDVRHWDGRVVTRTVAGLRRADQHCPACASAPGCGCLPMPAEWRRLGFSGLFHTTARCDQVTADAWRAKGLPHLLPGDGWAIHSFAGNTTARLVRHDSHAVVEAFTRTGDDGAGSYAEMARAAAEPFWRGIGAGQLTMGDADASED